MWRKSRGKYWKEVNTGVLQDGTERELQQVTLEVCWIWELWEQGVSGKIPGFLGVWLALRILVAAPLGSEELAFRAWYLWTVTWRHLKRSLGVLSEAQVDLVSGLTCIPKRHHHLPGSWLSYLGKDQNWTQVGLSLACFPLVQYFLIPQNQQVQPI